MSRSLLRVSLFALPFFLTACGDGWEAQKTTEFSPYGNNRTAGSGIVYVRARLLPQKDLKLEPELKPVEKVQELPAAPAEAVEPALKAEKIFSEAQTKGQSYKALSTSSDGEDHTNAEMSEHSEKHASIEETAPLLSEVEPESYKINRYIPSKTLSEIREKSQDHDDRDHVVVGTPIDAEDVLNHTIARDEAVNLTVPEHVREKESLGFESGLMHSELSPQAGDVLEDVVQIETGREYLAEQTLSQPIKEIVAPKRDRRAILSVGEETLDEIYSSPF